MTEFTERVLSVVREIPAGRVMSYREVAAAAGRPRAYRAVANLMAKNYDSVIPCHRVIKSDGTAGGYNRGGETHKRALLETERKQVNYGRH